MYLYLVTCVCTSSVATCLNETLDVYVVANDPTSAGELALNLMNKLQYKYNDRVENVKLLASTNTYRADSLLVIG